MESDAKLKKVNKNSPIPVYHQIKEALYNFIKTMDEGDIIPPLSELSVFFDVARPTVRHAVSCLVEEGLLEPRKGQGTFVRKVKIQQNSLYTFKSFNKNMSLKGLIHETKVLELKEITNPFFAKKLKIDISEKIMFLKRLRIVDGEPSVICDEYMPSKLMKNILFEHNLEKESLGNLIETYAGGHITRSDREVTACLASNEDSDLLEVEENSPLLVFNAITYLVEEIPVHFSILKYRGDRNKFLFTLEKSISETF